MPTVPTCAIVLFGASGDLAKLKLIPAMYEMAREQLLDERSYLVGYGRPKEGVPDKTDEEYRKESEAAIRKHARTKGQIDEALLQKVLGRLHFFTGHYDSAADHQ